MSVKTWTSAVYNETTKTWDSLKGRDLDAVETYKGLVLNTYCRDVRVMSDVWDTETVVLVWDPETKTPREIRGEIHGYAVLATRACLVEVDATPEVIAAYRAYQAEQAAKHAAAASLAYRSAVTTGKIVSVNRGRALRRCGSVGLLFWSQDGQGGTRVGVALTPDQNAKGQFANVVWTYAKNVDVVGAESEEAMKTARTAWERNENVRAAVKMASAA